MHRSVREPERTIGQLVSDPLFLPALIYSGTTAGENIPAIRVSASSVYVRPPRTLSPLGPYPVGMSLRATAWSMPTRYLNVAFTAFD